MSGYPLVFERSRAGRRAYRLPPAGVDQPELAEIVPTACLRSSPPHLPQLSEADVVRHYTGLSRRNFGVDIGFYPIGSCTMKYNPKINEDAAGLPGFTAIHPLQPDETVQGILELMYDLTERLCEITGMDWGTLQPFAGAHGELTALKLFRAHFDALGQPNRRRVLVPDSAHGTNPASAALAGFSVDEVSSNRRGCVDVEAVRERLGNDLAGIMLTNPNTLGLFENEIDRIADLVHSSGGLLYYDGANLNAILGKSRPGDMGFDVVHVNLHKTFATPHGGGGPGAGPILVGKDLVRYLPVPDIGRDADGYHLVQDRPLSIGRVAGFHGNVGVLVRAYAYLLAMGRDGLRRVSEGAVLNANYLKQLLTDDFTAPYPGVCKHEFVLSISDHKRALGLTALEISKRLLDHGIHPPTMYFPLVVPEALMIEPTETESKETLEAFAAAMVEILQEARRDPGKVKSAPHTTPVGRVDELGAARRPILRWTPEGE